MKTYTTTISKAEFVSELKNHQAADNFIRGRYWREGKGCAVGCSLKSISTIKNIEITDFAAHGDYETYLGIPEWLARVEDTLFEGMSLQKSKNWPVDFAEAIPEGVDLNQVKVPFLCMLMEHSLESINKAQYDVEQYPQVKSAVEQTKTAVKQMIDAQKLGDDAAISEAYSAARSAYSAAYEAAAYSAAAYSAAYSAYSAARSAYSAARSAYAAAYEADAAAAAAYAAAAAAYNYYADQLLILLRGCK